MHPHYKTQSRFCQGGGAKVVTKGLLQLIITLLYLFLGY